MEFGPWECSNASVLVLANGMAEEDVSIRGRWLKDIWEVYFLSLQHYGKSKIIPK